MTKKTLILFSNGNTAFCEDGEQVASVQKMGWLQLQFQWLLKCGYDPLTIDEILLPNGSHAIPFKTSNGNYNWEIKP
jgi:hypothetical protein